MEKRLVSDGRKIRGKDIIILEELFDKSLEICGIDYDIFVNLRPYELGMLQDEVSNYIERKTDGSVYHHKSGDKGRLYKVYQKRMLSALYGIDSNIADNIKIKRKLSYEDRVSKIDDLELSWDIIVGNSLVFYASQGEKKNWATYYSDIRKNKIGIPKMVSAELEDNAVLKDIMNDWKQEVLSNPYWEPVQMIFSFDSSADEMYQKMDVIPFNISDKILLTANPMAAEFELSNKQFDTHKTSYPIDHLLNLGHTCHALIGTPGIGKTSSLKWMLRQISAGKLSNFKNAIYISLRDLDNFLIDNSNESLYTFFFAVYNSKKLKDAIILGQSLEKLTSLDTNHSVFLLDALDEVPSKNRRLLIQKLSKELQGKTYIITTRPTAAYLLNLNPFIKLYEIIPLKKSAVRNLVVKYCENSQIENRSDDLLVFISHNLTINNFITSTFVLVIFCEIIAKKDKFIDIDFNRVSTGRLFELLVKIMQMEHSKINDQKITQAHLDILIDFAEELSCSSEEKLLSSRLICIEAIKITLAKSRYINEIIFHHDIFEFTHLRLQEYFTAEAILNREYSLIEQFLEQHIFDFEWLEIICLMAGLSIGTKIDENFNKTIEKYFLQAELELTKNSLIILMKILVAKKLNLKRKFGNTIPYYEGIKAIKEGHALAKDFISILLESNPIEFLKDLRKENIIKHKEIWLYIYFKTPFYLKESAGLHHFSPTEDFSLYFTPDPGFLFEQDLVKPRRIVARWKHENHNSVVVALSILKRFEDDESVEIMGEILRYGKPELQTPAIFTLAEIGTHKAMNQVVDIIMEFHNNREKMEMIASAFRYNTISDAISRERLFRWFVESDTLSPDTISSLIKIFLNTPTDDATSRKIAKLYIKDKTICNENLSYNFFKNVVDGYSLDLLIRNALQADSNEESDLIKLIPFIPRESFSLLDRIFDKLNQNTHIDEKIAYLSLLAKSYNKYPELLANVPSLLLEELDDIKDVGYVCKILEISRVCNHIDFLIEKALYFVNDNDADLSVRDMSIHFLNGSQIKIDDDLINKLMATFSQDQKDRSKFSFVKKALLFIVANSQNKSRQMCLMIPKHFDKENYREFLVPLVHFAQNQREIIFI